MDEVKSFTDWLFNRQKVRRRPFRNVVKEKPPRPAGRNATKRNVKGWSFMVLGTVYTAVVSILARTLRVLTSFFDESDEDVHASEVPKPRHGSSLQESRMHHGYEFYPQNRVRFWRLKVSCPSPMRLISVDKHHYRTVHGGMGVYLNGHARRLTSRELDGIWHIKVGSLEKTCELHHLLTESRLLFSKYKMGVKRQRLLRKRIEMKDTDTYSEKYQKFLYGAAEGSRMIFGNIFNDISREKNRDNKVQKIVSKMHKIPFWKHSARKHYAEAARRLTDTPVRGKWMYVPKNPYLYS